MDKYILFAGRKVPIQINAPVLRFDDGSAPSFYHPENTLSPDRLMQMALLRPTLQNYSMRFGGPVAFSRVYEQLFAITRDELDALGQHIWQIALHHDVTTNALDTYNVLAMRGLSTHFVVNYDGALYQFLDCYHVAWATGDNNNHSIAIDMNNPVYPELRDTDPAAGMREIYQGKVNGSVKTMLGYTDPQYDTLIALIKALTSPVQVMGEEPWVPMAKVAESCFPPISENGEVINRLLRDSQNFVGFLGHYHCSANKWDPGPAFDWLRVLSGIKGKRNSLPMLIGDPDKRRNLAEVGGKLLNELLENYYRNAELAPGGWYPVGSNQSWHSGIHLTAEKGTPVLNMMEGTIVAVRNVKTVDLGDPSFVLVRHEREEDVEGAQTPGTIYWYSLFMHLEPMVKEQDWAPVPWVSDLFGPDLETPDQVAYNMDLAAQHYERGVPQVVDGTARTKDPQKILDAFFRGDIILTNIPCEAGVQIGTIGRFGDKPDRLTRQLHVEVFSPDNIFARGSAQQEAWSIVEGDVSDYSLVRVKKLLKPIKDFVLNSTQRTPSLLKTSEIQNFYSMGNHDPLIQRKNDFRKMICYHRSEWSPMMNWTKTALQSVGWQWESEAAFGKWLLLWLPFQWMTKEVSAALGFPKKHFFFTYHPIYLLQQLNLTYAGDMSQNAEEAGDQEFKDNANELAARVEELVALNKRLENKEKLTPEERARHEELYQLMDDHLDDDKSDITSETRYDYYYDEDFDRWEPGEWIPPTRIDIKKV